MKRTWPIIGVANVQVSSEWYRTLLNAANNHPGDSTFDQVLDEDGTVLLCFHHWGDHDHPPLMSPHIDKPVNGMFVFFCVSDFDSALESANTLMAQLAEPPRVNPNTRAMEFSLRDPDGYYVTVSAFQPA